MRMHKSELRIRFWEAYKIRIGPEPDSDTDRYRYRIVRIFLFFFYPTLSLHMIYFSWEVKVIL
jgi:hypothetical protein